MSEYICPKYKIRIDPDSHKTQGLQAGDIVRRQYVARDRSIYSLMAVLESGVDVISGKESPYFVGALLEGDEPSSGELLDFVRLTNLYGYRQSGAVHGRNRRDGNRAFSVLSYSGRRNRRYP